MEPVLTFGLLPAAANVVVRRIVGTLLTPLKVVETPLRHAPRELFDAREHPARPTSTLALVLAFLAAIALLSSRLSEG